MLWLCRTFLSLLTSAVAGEAGRLMTTAVVKARFSRVNVSGDWSLLSVMLVMAPTFESKTLATNGWQGGRLEVE